MPHRSAATVSASLLTLTTAVHLVAQLTHAQGVATVTQWFLMPLLALSLWFMTRGAVPRTRLVRLVLLALGFSWLGDTAPDLVSPDASFLVMVGFFLVAQVIFSIAFWPHFRSLPARRRAVPAALYAVVLVVLLTAVVPGSGDLLVPVVVYGLCLATMATLATGLGRLAGLGGAIFLVSDALIALDAFVEGYRLPVHGFWVMATYVVGQALIAAAVLRAPAVDPHPASGDGLGQGPVVSASGAP